jgi:hypothetical protein
MDVVDRRFRDADGAQLVTVDVRLVLRWPGGVPLAVGQRVVWPANASPCTRTGTVVELGAACDGSDHGDILGLVHGVSD